jgi:hypothetical protein
MEVVYTWLMNILGQYRVRATDSKNAERLSRETNQHLLISKIE